jgi:hypothetical protein
MTIRVQKNKERIEFGDFQTPDSLACEICDFLWSQGVRPKSVVEPTCGKGSFLIASLKTFDSSKKFIATDINSEYMRVLSSKVCSFSSADIEFKNADFFLVDWHNIFVGLPKPLLIIGNPPWVTNSELGTIAGNNLPIKTNFQNHKGLDAITGKANFDISEWMLIHLLDCAQNHVSVLAMLCKTSVARKVLRYAWQNNFRVAEASIHVIDAKRHFNVSVDACLLVCKTGRLPNVKQCTIYKGLSTNNRTGSIGQHNSGLLVDPEKYVKWSRFDAIAHYKWRSGVKHDCAKVLELSCEGNRFTNGLGEICDIEKDFLYPLFKSSSVANNKVGEPKLWVLITQKNMSDDPAVIEKQAPKTWDYLKEHAHLLDKRKSSIYKGRPRFSIFGIGDYAFAPWKVSISGLYKKIHFSVISPYMEKPSMVDDTCYYLPCKNQEEAISLSKLLNSEATKKFLDSFIFWDSKRPITIDVLRRINISALAKELGISNLQTVDTCLPFN